MKDSKTKILSAFDKVVKRKWSMSPVTLFLYEGISATGASLHKATEVIAAPPT
jgi:hypothetical protein